MVETTSVYTPQPMKAKSKKAPIIITIVVVLLLIVGAVFLLQPKKEEKKEVTAVVTEQPTPTTKPPIDKKSVKIQVTNGTGTPGQAGTAVTALKDAGYEAGNIKTGNADTFNNKVTTITVKAGFEDVANDIKDVLSSTFSTIKIESSQLDASSEFDVVIVTGGEIFVEPTSASPTTKPTGTTSTPTPSSVTPTTSVTSSPTPSPTP
jgi:hypothetical protein